MIGKFAATLAMAFALTGCAQQAPVQPVALAACQWTPHPATASFVAEGFACLDGSGQPVPAGLPAPSIVNVWGSWCPPCREEIPYFVRLAAEHDVTIIGVDVDEPSWATGQRFAQSRGMGWPNLLDTTGESTSIFGNGVPVTWFINAEGEVAEKKIGGLADYDELLELARRSGQL